jgi:hypothetical protein
MATRFDYAAALLERRTKARRQGGEISARSLRRDRQRLQSLRAHPGVQPAEDVESFTEKGMQDVKGIQGPPAPQLPGDEWTSYQVCPSYGGASGRRMSDSARYNAEEGIMEVRFDSGGRGVPNTYAYDGISPEMFRDFMSGRLSYNSTATAYFLKSLGGVRVS